ncbi:MAG: Uncharacterised protein [Methanobacteriota archaeon]|nr:MAG: Uncharacterised protein [Euryarchaeota archaeon]
MSSLYDDEDLEDDEQYDEAGLKLSLFKIVFWWLDMDIIENHSDNHDLDYCLYDYIDSFTRDINAMIEGKFSEFYVELVDWVDIFTCLELVSKRDTLVKEHYDEILALKVQCEIALVDGIQSKADSKSIESNDDNRPAWGRGK